MSESSPIDVFDLSNLNILKKTQGSNVGPLIYQLFPRTKFSDVTVTVVVTKRV